MKLRLALIPAIALGILMVSCKQEVSFQKTKGGMPYKIFSTKDTARVDTNDFVKIHYKQMLNDSVMVSTFDNLPIHFQVTGQSQPYDPSELFLQLKKGDSVVAVQLIDTFMARMPGQLPPQFKKGDKLTTHIKVLEIFKTGEESFADEQKSREAFLANEIKEVEDYIKKNNIQATRTPSGAYVEITEKGNGPKIDSGNYVMVLYKGRTFDGKVFDTNMDSSFQHPGALAFVPGNGNKPGGSIPGFDESLLLLSGGDKARFYIPSLLAYGASGSRDMMGQFAIKPFEHLIFDIQIESVAPKPPKEFMQQMQQHTDPH